MKPPSGTSGDTAHLIARAVITAMPGIGGTALEMFNAIVVPPLERRRNEWMEHMAQAFEELQKRVTRLEDLQNNEGFIDVVIKASRIAVSDNQKEKIDALKNAIINAGTTESIDRALQQIFLGYIDTFSVWHFKILELLNNPPASFGIQSQNEFAPVGSLDMVQRVIPELRGREQFFTFVWKDLYTKGLVNQEVIVVRPGSTYLTSYGSQFVAFINLPR